MIGDRDGGNSGHQAEDGEDSRCQHLVYECSRVE